MAEQSRGKRPPKNPAPVSGPGRLSRRTDGGPSQVNAEMTGMGYGENKDFMQIQSAAPMAATPGPKKTAKTSSMGSKASPLFSVTQRPDEPITAGANFGPGVSASKPINSSRKNLTSIYSQLASENPTQENLDYLALAQRMGY